MIKLLNRDREIFDFEYRIADIINEYQNTGCVTINTNSEGLCLRRAGVYDILDYVCNQFNINKQKITIQTLNVLEYHDEYTVEVSPSPWLLHTFENVPKSYVASKQPELKHLGCFIGKSNWNRLAIASWLRNNFSDNVLLTFHYNHTDQDKLSSGLTDLNFYMPECLADAVELLNDSPITLEESFNGFESIYPDKWMQMITQYDQVFADFVVETYVMGNSFFPTEKTLRPIIAKTPFIVMAPPNYLQNFKRCGFKTFSQWWDESYDYCEGADRIKELQKVVQNICSWSQSRLQDTLAEMQATLDYNYNYFVNEFHPLRTMTLGKK